jgi:hypothetical protein
MPKEIDMIQVRQTAEQNPLIFEVVVREGKGEPRHQVTMSRETCERLTSDKHTPEHCLEPDIWRQEPRWRRIVQITRDTRSQPTSSYSSCSRLVTAAAPNMVTPVALPLPAVRSPGLMRTLEFSPDQDP